jgi:REP element-mobilizing transposase RayT
MANSYSSLHIHVVFSTKDREKILDQKIRNELWPYMGGIAKENKMIPIAIGGVEDHSHLLLCIPPALSVSRGVQIIKTGSSRWLHENFKIHRYFAWQVGYGAFTVSPGRVAHTVNYIQNQERHHHQTTFQEEYLKFLEESGVVFDERYLWG